MSDPRTAESRYDALFATVFPLYQQGRYVDALARLDEDPGDLAEWSAMVTEIRACLLALTGRIDAALATLQGGLDAGEWWDPHMLDRDPDLAKARDLPGYDAVLRESGARAAAYNSAASPGPPVVVHPAGTARGVLVVLHGSGGRPAKTAEQWSAAGRAGVVVLAARSSHRTTPATASWVDESTAARDLRSALDHLDADTAALPVIAAGFSAGGRAALQWVVAADPVPVHGAVLVAPSLLAEQVPQEIESPLHGLALVGGDDPMGVGMLTRGDALRRAGLVIEELPGVGHAYPDDFDARLTRALDELLTRTD
ncbi:MAG TPA: alpha/beta hydrolase [Actinomycetes bacterium]|jgi:dienelactone hydrolase|nr:alpha/beta hydrolase [Actinomycetes bacterium]